MPAQSHRRTEIAPLSVRMSRDERGSARQKARLLTTSESELARMAIAEFDAEAALERRRRTFHVETNEVLDAVGEALA